MPRWCGLGALPELQGRRRNPMSTERFAGPVSLHLLAELLGKPYSSMAQFVVDHAVPVMSVGAEKKPVQKVMRSQLLKWLNARQQGRQPMTMEELNMELRD